jgi:putative FmdB family regulatory protein
MPTYEYRCAKCGGHLEVFQSFSETPLTKHPSCGGKLAKVLSPAGIVLKGSGFYKTDNRSSGSSKEKRSDTKSDRTAAESKSSESKSSESKSSESKSSEPKSSSGDGGSSSGSSEAKSA